MRASRRQVVGAAALGLATTGFRSSSQADARFRPVRLRVNGLDRPLALDRPAAFSWALDGGGAGAVQSAYRIVCADSAEALANGPWLWDSGEVRSAAMTGVAHGGTAPGPGRRLWWTVRAADAEGRWSAPAEPSWFEGGLADWSGDWIEAETPAFRAERLGGFQWIWGETAIEDGPRAFRWRFEVPADATGHVMVAAKDSLRGLWLDGRPLVQDGQRTAWGQAPEFDLGALTPGPHVLAVEAGLRTDEGRPVIGGALAVIARLSTTGGPLRLVAGAEARTSSPVTGTDWFAADFDDSGWSAARPAEIDPGAWPLPAQGAVLMRRSFRLERPVKRARLHVTALGAYEPRLNGAKVGDTLIAPETTDFRTRALYQTHDVTDRLVVGDNVLGAEVADGFFASPFSFLDMRYAFGPPPRRLLVQLEVEHDDGSTVRIVTDGDWRLADSPLVFSEIYDGETHDARRAVDGWDQPGFDDSAWTPVQIGARPPCRLEAQAAAPLRVTQTLKPARITRVGAATILDFGQNFTGWCRLHARGAAGTTIRLRFAEALHPDGNLNVTSNRRALQTDTVVLKGDPAGEVWEPKFTYHGFRYVEVTGWPGDLAPDAVEGRVVHSDTALTGAFRCSDVLVEQIWRNTLWSQRSNFTGVPTDCPQRDERMGWTGDAQIFWDAAAYNMDVEAFTRRYMGDVRAGQAETGEMPDVAPYWAVGQNTPGWSDAAIILPWTTWRRSGATGIIEDNWAAMRRWNDRLLALNPDHVWRNSRGMDYGDWLSVDARSREDVTTPKELISTAYWAHSTGLLAEMARATGRAEEAALLEARRATIVRAWCAAFVGADGLVGNNSQTSHILGLRFGLTPENQRARSAARLRADIARRGDALSTGFIGTPYILDALADHGHEDMAVSLLLQRKNPSWGYMIDQGATTIWERWTGSVGGVVTGSLNHYALGAITGFLYRRVAGITETAPGFERVEVRPIHDPRLTSAGATYESVRGRIRVDWWRAGGRYRLEADVPANTTALIHLPDGRVTEGGRAVGARGPVRLVERSGGKAVVEAGAGRWRFTVS